MLNLKYSNFMFKNKTIDFILRYIIYISYMLIIFLFIYKIFYSVWDGIEYSSQEVYKNFLSNFLCTWSDTICFYDRYWYWFHYLQSLLLLPFLIFKFFIWELQFTWTWFIFTLFDQNINNIIFYSWKIISLLSFVGLFYFLYKILYYFTKNHIISLFPILLLWTNTQIIEYATLYKVDLALTTFCIWSLYFAIKYLDKYNIKYLFFFIFFSIFAFIIKYQALMYISWLYIIILFYSLWNKKYKDLWYWLLFFIFFFIFFNFNYSLLVENLILRFNLDAHFLKLNDNQLINSTYWFLDWLNIILDDIKERFLYIAYYLIILWSLSYIIFFRRVYTKYYLLLLLPLFINYYIQLFVVHILNEWHYLMLLSVITLISIIWLYYLFQFMIKKYNLNYINNIVFLLLFLLLFLSQSNTIFYEYKETSNNKTNELFEYISAINDSWEKIFHIKDLHPIPYWIEFLFSSDVYNKKWELIFSSNVNTWLMQVERNINKWSLNKLVFNYDFLLLDRTNYFFEENYLLEKFNKELEFEELEHIYIFYSRKND